MSAFLKKMQLQYTKHKVWRNALKNLVPTMTSQIEHLKQEVEQIMNSKHVLTAEIKDLGLVVEYERTTGEVEFILQGPDKGELQKRTKEEKFKNSHKKKSMSSEPKTG